MGSDNREPDEGPVHPVFLSPYWISSTPISWETLCNMLGYGIPPDIDYELARNDPLNKSPGQLFGTKICLQYCEDETIQARDWHCHIPPTECDEKLSSHFPPPPRKNVNAPYTYGKKPVVAVNWQAAATIGERISNDEFQFALPSEAQWEKAARGGLFGKKYAWGDEPVDGRADCDRFRDISILPSKTYPANGYGLYAVCGGVWEWTLDWYDAEYFAESPRENPSGPQVGKSKVLRGGSWGDCPDACTVSFRMAYATRKYNKEYIGTSSPNIGFRLCRKAISS